MYQIQFSTEEQIDEYNEVVDILTKNCNLLVQSGIEYNGGGENVLSVTQTVEEKDIKGLYFVNHKETQCARFRVGNETAAELTGLYEDAIRNPDSYISVTFIIYDDYTGETVQHTIFNPTAMFDRGAEGNDTEYSVAYPIREVWFGKEKLNAIEVEEELEYEAELEAAEEAMAYKKQQEKDAFAQDMGFSVSDDLNSVLEEDE